MNLDWSPFLLTLRLAAVTTAALLVIGLPLAYRLAYSRSRWKPVAEAIISLPLVLPPTVLGFYLLVAFSPNQAFGQWLETWLGLRLVFSFSGLVVASVIYSLPFMVQPIQAGLSSLSPSLREAAYVLGKSEWTTFWRVLVPNIRPAVLTGIVLSFAHTIGEFGVVLMIGGNLPGETRVVSIAIYDAVERLDYDSANAYSLILLAFSFTVLLVVYTVRLRGNKTGLL